MKKVGPTDSRSAGRKDGPETNSDNDREPDPPQLAPRWEDGWRGVYLNAATCTSAATRTSRSIMVRVALDPRAARTGDPHAAALHRAVQIAAPTVLLEEGVEVGQERHRSARALIRRCQRSSASVQHHHAYVISHDPLEVGRPLRLSQPTAARPSSADHVGQRIDAVACVGYLSPCPYVRLEGAA